MTKGSTNNQHRHSSLHPQVIQDTSSGGPGLVAGELAAEEASILGHEAEENSPLSEGSSQPGTPGSTNISTKYGATQDAESPDEHGGFALPKGQLYVVASGVYLATFLAALDSTVVTTLLTTIASELNEVKNIAWIATSYLLSSAAFQPLFGKLSDIFGRKPLLFICGLLFALGCLICSTDSFTWLIIGRFITGIGGSGFLSLGTITMSDMIPLRERGVFQGLGNVFFGLGAASGGIVGGVVADTLGWRWVFILQVPLALLVTLIIYIYLNLPAGSPGLGSQGNIKEKLKRVDFLGSFFLVSGLMAFMTAASLGGSTIEFTSKTFSGLLIASAILFAIFVYVELHVSAEPILPLELLGLRTVLASSLTNWFCTMGVFAYIFYIPVFFTSVVNLSATQNGLRLVPNFFGVAGGSVGAGIYMRKTGKYYNLVVSIGLLAVLSSLRFLTLSPQSSLFDQFTIMLIPGVGYSCMLTVTLLALIASVPAKYQASTTSIQYTFRSTGSTIGVTIASAIFQRLLKSGLTTKIHAIISDDKLAKEIISKALESTNYVKEAPEIVQSAIRQSYDYGCKGAFAFSITTIFLGFVSSLFMKEHKLHTSVSRD